MKQTAVDILYKFLYEMESFEGFDPYNFKQEDVFNKAKEMEKQQIIDAHIDGFYSPPFGKSRNREAEQYYNETFKTE